MGVSVSIKKERRRKECLLSFVSQIYPLPSMGLRVASKDNVCLGHLCMPVYLRFKTLWSCPIMVKLLRILI